MLDDVHKAALKEKMNQPYNTNEPIMNFISRLTNASNWLNMQMKLGLPLAKYCKRPYMLSKLLDYIETKYNNGRRSPLLTKIGTF